MKCPECGGNTTVSDSREDTNSCYIRRRRKCKSCGYRFSTIEVDIQLYKKMQEKPRDRKEILKSYGYQKLADNIMNDIRKFYNKEN